MDSRFSIVMQGGILDKVGSIDTNVIDNIEIIRREFPLSEFILSTWNTGDSVKQIISELAEKFSFIVIYNEDPGGMISSDKVVTSNINRMIISTKNGIKAAKREFIIKIRTDSYLYNKNIVYAMLHIIGSRIENKRDDRFKIFDNYIINCSLFARDAKGYLPYLFHPGDICLAGTNKDMLSLFDLKLADKSIFRNISRVCFLSFMKYVPEQFIWISCIENKIGKIVYAGNEFYDKPSIELSERYYVNNFIVFSPEQLGFKWPKYRLVYNSKGLHSIYSINDWKLLYNKYNKNYYIVDNTSLIRKKVITINMMVYFFARTSLLKIPALRKLAIKLFRKRG